MYIYIDRINVAGTFNTSVLRSQMSRSKLSPPKKGRGDISHDCVFEINEFQRGSTAIRVRRTVSVSIV